MQSADIPNENDVWIFSYIMGYTNCYFLISLAFMRGKGTERLYANCSAPLSVRRMLRDMSLSPHLGQNRFQDVHCRLRGAKMVLRTISGYPKTASVNGLRGMLLRQQLKCTFKRGAFFAGLKVIGSLNITLISSLL